MAPNMGYYISINKSKETFTMHSNLVEYYHLYVSWFQAPNRGISLGAFTALNEQDQYRAISLAQRSAFLSISAHKRGISISTFDSLSLEMREKAIKNANEYIDW
jgi:hypothetical protein